MRCSFTAERDFGAVDAIHARFATGCATSRNDDVAGKEAELHQAAGDVFGKIQAIEHASFTLGELSK
jgi:hypothetical protein